MIPPKLSFLSFFLSVLLTSFLSPFSFFLLHSACNLHPNLRRSRGVADDDDDDSLVYTRFLSLFVLAFFVLNFLFLFIFLMSCMTDVGCARYIPRSLSFVFRFLLPLICWHNNILSLAYINSFPYFPCLSSLWPSRLTGGVSLLAPGKSAPNRSLALSL